MLAQQQDPKENRWTEELRAPPTMAEPTQQNRTALSALAAECGLKIMHLCADEAKILLYALQYEELVKDLKIPIATKVKASSGEVMVEREIEKVLPKTRYTAGEEESLVPANSLSVRQNRGLPELPKIFPAQWVLDELSPELFLKKAAGSELLTPQWIQEMVNPVTADEVQKVKELFKEAAPPERLKQNAHVLLDVSSSMEGERILKAKGLAMAFFRNAYRNRSTMMLRFFNDEVDPNTVAHTQNEFHRLIDTLMSRPAGGDTNIAEALDCAINDIRRDESSRADILLLTDGEARLQRNNLNEIKLHTIILGEENSNFELRSWSKTFRNIPDEGQLDIIKDDYFDKLHEQLKHITTRIGESNNAEEIAENFEALQELIAEIELLERLGLNDGDLGSEVLANAKSLMETFAESSANEMAESNQLRMLGSEDYLTLCRLLSLRESLRPSQELLARTGRYGGDIGA